MKNRIVSALSITAFAAALSACGAATAVPSNTAAVVKTNTAAAATTVVAPPATPAPVDGSVLKIDEAGLMMTVPKNFKFSKDGEDTVVKTEDEGVEVRFHVPQDGNYEKAVTAGMIDLDKYINDIKVDGKATAEKDPNSGLDMTSSGGSGTDEDGKPILWQMTIIDAPKKPVLVVIYAEDESMKKHSADLTKFFASVRKQ